MKTIIVILMLADFAGVAFGRGLIPDWLYFSLMPIMVGLLVAYWFIMYWFSSKKLTELLGKEPDFQIFAGRVPKDNLQDLDRGRLIVLDGKMELYQRKPKEKKCSKVWSLPVSDIKSLGFGTLLPLRRKGLRVFTEDDTIEFTTAAILKRKEELYKALGWVTDKSVE